MKGDDSRQHQVEGSQQLHRGGKQQPLLALSETPGPEGPLDDHLVGAPVEPFATSVAKQKQVAREPVFADY